MSEVKHTELTFHWVFHCVSQAYTSLAPQVSQGEVPRSTGASSQTQLHLKREWSLL